MGRALDRLERLLDDMFPGLGQYLHRHIIRNHILLNQRAHELIFRLRGRRESHLNLLEANVHQHLEELQFLLQAHWLD